MKFTASCIDCKIEDGVAVLGFADDEFKARQYLLLTRTLQPDQQDCSLGFDRVHVELNDQKWSAYGDIEEVQLQTQGAIFRLDPATAAKVSHGEAIKVAFDVTATRLKEMADQLRLLVGKGRIHITLNG